MSDLQVLGVCFLASVSLVSYLWRRMKTAQARRAVIAARLREEKP